MKNNNYNFEIWGWEISDFYQDIDASNLVDNKPIYYWTNKKNAPNSCKNAEISDANNTGFVALVSCDNITVKNSNLTKKSHGILLVNTTNSKILNNTVNNNWHYGIYLVSSSNNTLTNNTANNNNYGIHLSSSSNNTLINNIVNDNNYYGIWLSSSSNNTLINNTANNNYEGILLYFSSNNTLTNNTANNKWYGIYIFGNSNFNKILDNKISNNDETGITISNCAWGHCYYEGNSNNTIEGNEILNNKVGIFSKNSNSIINNNYVCGNTQWDFNSTNWLSSYGDNNACDKPDGWNDANTIRCTNTCKGKDIFDAVEMLEYLSGEKTELSHQSEYYKFVGRDSGNINLLDVFDLMDKIVEG